jgi:hypothetical protein
MVTPSLGNISSGVEVRSITVRFLCPLSTRLRPADLDSLVTIQSGASNSVECTCTNPVIADLAPRFSLILEGLDVNVQHFDDRMKTVMQYASSRIYFLDLKALNYCLQKSDIVGKFYMRGCHTIDVIGSSIIAVLESGFTVDTVDINLFASLDQHVLVQHGISWCARIFGVGILGLELTYIRPAMSL